MRIVDHTEEALMHRVTGLLSEYIEDMKRLKVLRQMESLLEDPDLDVRFNFGLTFLGGRRTKEELYEELAAQESVQAALDTDPEGMGAVIQDHVDSQIESGRDRVCRELEVEMGIPHDVAEKLVQVGIMYCPEPDSSAVSAKLREMASELDYEDDKIGRLEGEGSPSTVE